MAPGQVRNDGKKVTIVGAGVGGVALAARLAKAGFDVTVLEKNDFIGGRCSLIHQDGYRFDQGPSLLLLPEFFNETFADLNTTMANEGIQIVKCEPNYKVYFDDGECITLTSDLAQMKDEIERWEGRDGFQRYLGFLQESHRHYEISAQHVLHKNFTSLLHLARPSFLRYLITLHPFESIWNRAARYFYTERLRRAFTFGSMYMGMSPFDAPGTYSLLQYAELVRAIWYPIGGFHKVPEALANIGKRLGVTYRLSAPVTSITLSDDGSRTTGVLLESGEHISSDIVVVNADLVYAYNNLLPKTTAASVAHAAALSKRKTSCSSISFYWCMDRIIPELKVHNIFLAEDYKESFDDIFQRQEMPTEPSFYLNVPSRADPTAAPEGKDAIVVLVPIGHMVEEGNALGLNVKTPKEWEQVVERARDVVIEVVEKRTGRKGFREAIAKEVVNTPQIWKDKFNLDKGGILGLSHSFFNVLSFRPGTSHPSISNCYFVGASTHPGTGVPVCLAGAKVTAEQILSNEKILVPWAEYAPSGTIIKKVTSKLDQLNGGVLADVEYYSWHRPGKIVTVESPYFKFGPAASTSSTPPPHSTPIGRRRKATNKETNTPSPTKCKVQSANTDPKCVCQTLHEHVASAKPRLIQSVIAHDPWKLIIAVTLLNQTAGKAAVPRLWQILERYPNPKALSEAAVPDLTDLIACLGLQNVRASRLIQMSAMYCMDPPNLEDCRPSRVPTFPQVPTKANEALLSEWPLAAEKVKYPPTAISHLPGVGQYALDSYRIFSPDLPGGGAAKDENACVIRVRLTVPNEARPEGPSGVAEPFISVPFISDPDAEWRQVMPFDKELRKYLIWRWAIENVEWDPLRGILGVATPESLWRLSHSFNTS
ncbi:hypothetical protein FRB97_001270 [Tulasnella sp. 331]|nr:hypothetical protein FRB97_001270 [Tulasnella sp. 331]KAG8886459.1 hypothetical protein FRB98_001278 [Tulasnella sp. 332]